MTYAHGNRVSVLLVDDDEEDRFLARDCLSDVPEPGFDVVETDSYEEAVAALAKNEHDVCLLDMHLGARSGLDLIREAKAAGSAVPVILLTGAGAREIDMEATAAGAADYIEKGRLSPDVIERSIRYAMEHARILQRLKESEARTRMILDTAIDAVISLTEDGEIESFNRGASDMFGFAPDEVIGMSIRSLVLAPHDIDDDEDPHQHDDMPDDAAAELTWQEVLDLDDDLTGRRKNTSTFPVDVSLSRADINGHTLYTVIARDVTERKQAQEQLEHQALHDALTGLPNRVLFFDRVEHAMTKMARTRRHVAVFLLDLDGFKGVNDTLGHAAGDDLLVNVAERLTSCIRPSDTVARLGGDEFVVLCENLRDRVEAEEIAARLVTSLTMTVPSDVGDLYVSTSVGVAVADDPDADVDEILANADTAMYQAKQGGRCQYKVYAAGMADESTNRRG